MRDIFRLKYKFADDLRSLLTAKVEVDLNFLYQQFLMTN
jgi:hypothetical protein